MVRQALIILFGLFVGAAYAALFYWLIYPSPVAVAALTGFGGLVGWMCGRTYSRATNKRAKRDVRALTIYVVLLFPVLTPLFLVAFAFVVAFMALMMFYALIHGTVAERRLRRRLKAQGRLASVHELRPKFAAGEGVFLAETAYKGAYRLWWTPDDLLALGEPVKDDQELLAVLNGDKEHEFNTQCLRDYLDEESGKAVLVLRSGAVDRLTRQYPNLRVVTVVRPVPWAENHEDDAEDGSTQKGDDA